MSAVSSAQHGMMGLVLSVKSGKTKIGDVRSGIRKKIERMASEMTTEQLKDYTSTPVKGLPKHATATHTRTRHAKE